MISWNQVTIIGVGLIGGSLGMALKSRGLARRVVGVGHRQASLDEALARGAADRVTLDPAEGVRGSDLVVLATAIGLFEPILREIAPALEPGATVIDVGSTKGRLVAALEPLVPQGRHFVGCHPIAGSEQRGVGDARADLFEGAACVVTPTARTSREALERVADTWKAVGMVLQTLTPEAHDRYLAEVSHLPHVTAAALVGIIGAEAEPLVGPGWADTTRVASGTPALWRDILLSNAAELSDVLRRLEAALADWRDALGRGDATRIEALLKEAKTRRDRLMERKEGR